MRDSPGPGFLSSTFTIKSSLVNYYFNLTFDDPTNSTRKPNVYASSKELTVILFGPKSFPINEYQSVGTFHGKGLALYIFRDESGKGVFYFKEYPNNGYMDIRKIFSQRYYVYKGHYCNHDYVNKSVSINATIDFNNSRIIVHVNNEFCFNQTFNDHIYYEHQSSVSLMTYQNPETKVDLWLDELSIYKQYEPISSHSEHFHCSTHKLSETVHSKDVHYLKNISLANTFISGVG